MAGETTRAQDGLALSSRNGYLDVAQRRDAVALSRELKRICDEVRQGRRDWSAMEKEAMHTLAARGRHPDYVAIRRRADLGAAEAAGEMVVLAAARLGATRLIDNLELKAS